MRFILALVCALFATKAWAVDFSKVLLDGDDKPLCLAQIKEGEECPADKLLTLGLAVRNALYASFPDEQNLAGEDKFKRAILAQATTGKGDYKIGTSDIELMKKVVAKLYGPLVVYRAWTLLDAK